MFFRRKKTNLNIQRFDGFHIQIKNRCKGGIDRIFFELKKPVEECFIEYLKPFGYPIPLPGGITEITKEGWFKLLVPIGRKAFQADFIDHKNEDAQNLLVQQVYRGVNGIIRENILDLCPEDAVIIDSGRFTVDLKKCTYCLDCVK